MLTDHIPTEVNSLLVALSITEPNLKPLQTLTDASWEKLLEFCDTANLTLQLAQLPLAGIPTWVVDRLQHNLADNAQRYERIKKTYREAASALEHAGVEHIVIKGFTQAPEYVSDPIFRLQSDLDLYCPPDQIDAAQAALESIGYHPEKSVNISSADHGYGLIRSGRWQWKGNHYDPEMPIGIDLHFCLWNEKVSKIALPETDNFWKRHTSRSIGDLSFPCLDPVDHLGYLSLHILRNLLLRDWIIHHVRELALFLHTHADDDPFWNRWRELHTPALRALQSIAFYHARAWFQCRLHSSVEQQIAGLPSPHRSWLNRFSPSSLENMFTQNKDELWLHLSLISSRKDQWEILKRTLVPPRLAGVRSVTVRVRNKKLVHSEKNYFQQYLVYLFERSYSHGRASLSTLLRGLLWQFSR